MNPQSAFRAGSADPDARRAAAIAEPPANVPRGAPTLLAFDMISLWACPGK
jgi:hypothetical protein